jgi:voltage-gated potassium channel
MERLRKRIAYVAMSMLLVLTVGTTGFVVVEDFPPFDAFYMTLTTMTTIGYAEIRPLGRQGRIFNSFLILFGVTTILASIGAITQAMVELEIEDIAGKRRHKRMIQNLDKHFIICGYGRVGRSVAAELKHARVSFVITDINPGRVENAMRAGYLAVNADATRDATLRDIGIAKARGLVAALATDADNLFVILSAKNLNPQLYVATRAAEEEAGEKLRRAGADAVFAPYTMTGHRLAQSLLRPHVLNFLDVTTGALGIDVGIEQVRVSESSEFVARSIQDMQIRRDLGVIVLAIRKAGGEMVLNPPASTTIEGGDFLIVMGKQERLRTLEGVLA